MTDTQETLGPIDYVVLEFPGNNFNGDVLPALVDLIASGTVRILDLAFIAKDDAGEVVYGELEDLDDAGPLGELGAFLTDLITEEDLDAAAADLPNGCSEMVIIWENTWAAPFAKAVLGSGGSMVASGRLAGSEVLAALTEES